LLRPNLTSRNRQVGHCDLVAEPPIGAVAFDPAVERVAFDRFAAGFGDQSADFVNGHFFRGFGTGFMVDFFMDDRAVEVIGPEGQGDLRWA